MTAPEPRPRTSLLSRLILLVGVALGVFVLGEVAARWFGPSRVVVGPNFTEHDPVYGTRLKPGFTARRTTPESSFVLRTNSLGFRDPRPGGPLEGTILFLGDSHTLGYGVGEEETFPALIRARLEEAGPRDVPVVNAGLPQSGIGWWLPFLERRAPGFSPRAVVLQLSADNFGGDQSDRLFTLRDGALEPRDVAPRSWRHRTWSVIDAVPGLGYSHLVSTLRLRSHRRPARRSPGHAAARAEGYPLTRALLVEALDRARSRGWPVVGLLVGLEREEQDAAVEAFDAWGVPWVRVPSEREAPELYFEDGNLRAEGHRVAADRVWGALEIGLDLPPARAAGAFDGF